MIERRQVARPPAGEVLRIERGPEQPAVGNPPIGPAHAPFEFGKQLDEIPDVGGRDDPVGVFRVLLEPVFDAGHSGREHTCDRPPPKPGLERPGELDGAAHRPVFSLSGRSKDSPVHGTSATMSRMVEGS
jgi:hypothetical protein